MIVKQEAIVGHSPRFGDKTKNLKKLVDHGFLVPDFVAIPSDTVVLIDRDPHKLEALCTEIRALFPQRLYAIRSSALIEDQQGASMAGQFHTETKVPPAELAAAITKVIEQSKTLLSGDLEKFSLLIQEYIEADVSGVCFTRDPNGDRESVIEYFSGAGDNIVEGKITPAKTAFHRNAEQTPSICDVTIFQAIEDAFGFPQDIEWCTKDGRLFILQTRPITTISENKYQEMLFLDKTLASEKDFYYAKTAIAEISPRPTPFTFSLLKAIYAANGPIMNVYKRHHIAYTPDPFLTIIGNELFVDREAELKTLLPSFSILNDQYRPRLRSIRYLPRSIRNIFFTANFKADKSIAQRLLQSLASPKPAKDFAESLKKFLDDYEIIFEINIVAAQYLKRLEMVIKREKLSIADLLAADLPLFDTAPFEMPASFTTTGLIGNSLEIADETEFFPLVSTPRSEGGILAWWRKLPQWKQNLYKKPLTRAILFQRYCEYARTLMVQNLTEVRRTLLELSVFPTKKLIYFHTLEEIHRQQWERDLCETRKAEYEKSNMFELPARLTKRHLPQSSSAQGISSGIAAGFVVEERALSESPEPRILYTKILSPQLTRYFSGITGIISEKGGLLSHLAIIARENNIPVVVIGDKKDFEFGDYLTINGSTGDIKKRQYPPSQLSSQKS